MNEVRIAGLQLEYRSGEARPARIARVLGELRAAPSADLLVIPELWDVGYFAFDDYPTAARPIEEAAGPIGEIARARARTIVAGSVLERAGAAIHNTCVVIGRDGSIAGTYRKRHLFAYGSQEADLLTPGNDDGVVPSDVGLLGVATCFDLRFPELFAELAEAAVDLLVVPAAWPAPRASHWDVLVRARAIETQTPIVAINGTGVCEGVDLAGGSLIVDARGNELARAGAEQTWLEATIDLDDARAWRQEFPIRDRTAVTL